MGHSEMGKYFEKKVLGSTTKNKGDSPIWFTRTLAVVELKSYIVILSPQKPKKCSHNSRGKAKYF